jgi:hypothetical protein
VERRFAAEAEADDDGAGALKEGGRRSVVIMLLLLLLHKAISAYDRGLGLLCRVAPIVSAVAWG